MAIMATDESDGEENDPTTPDRSIKPLDPTCTSIVTVPAPTPRFTVLSRRDFAIPAYH